MTTQPNDLAGYRISIVDEDALRARKDARELLAEIADADPAAALDIPRQRTPGGSDKGGLSADTVGVLISAGSLVASGVQIWLARVPQRTVVVRRPDGSTLQITGREAREDDERIERFLAGGGEDGDGDSGTAAG
ncbi:effector-associated constant component EACC1 [Streptomyces endophytica]|uniref:Uncharacterized protein n=1 Tax=Streptomyces endophytica TaxID=2991496 RepID=A0ABY6PJ55_9ACTN|nr:hypothetical protein [Streptomyces endophytica]UZJ33831.1 hypothetical protein OJ254_30685 [Streptomyces endophytica]